MTDQQRRKYDNDQFVEFYMVWTKPEKTIAPSMFSPKKSYEKQYLAISACKEMAKRYPGKKFFVMKAVFREVIPVEVKDV